MPPRARPPSEADAPSVVQVILVVAALGGRREDGTRCVAELARARGRGPGRALLPGLFRAFRAGGPERAEPGVHGRDREALALDESVGMRTTREAERWRKALGRA